MRKYFAIFFSLFISVFFSTNSKANGAAYEQRKEAYVDNSLSATSGNKLILQAYRDVPVDTVQLRAQLNSIATRTTSDFVIIEMIRILFLTNGEYDADILPVLYGVPYWINNADTTRNFWSENHMIMWMSSDWLLHERYNKPIDNTLDARLRHYLRLKNQYGFYEFFSSTYAPYSLSALLNLADFSADTEIKTLATSAAQRLMADFLKLTNNAGVFYPVAGRNYPGKYDSPYGQNHNNIIYLLTGMGDAPTSASAAGPFLASSSIQIDDVAASWTPVLDTIYNIGHTLDSGFIINSQMSSVDKTVFQWSSGAYFHPAVVSQTVQLLGDSNLWRHVDFDLLRPLSTIIAPQSAPGLAESLSCISKSTVICGQSVTAFKHNGIVLSTINDFWKGKVGFQQYPCVATVGTIPVYTGSGQVWADWNDRNANNQNVHLPYAAQKKNVSLQMYRPEFVPEILGNNFTYKDVALRWTDSDFDEVTEDGLWLLGRKDENYVAVRRNCTGTINGVRACPTNGGQTWVTVVGDSGMYQNFTQFSNLVHQSQYTENWYNDTAQSKLVYFASVTFDTTHLEYAWAEDSVFISSINEVNAVRNYSIFPNPANNALHIISSQQLSKNGYITITSLIGETLLSVKLNDSYEQIINTSALPEGMYLLRLQTDKAAEVHQFVIRH